jgi:hypothetical protein
VTEPDVAFGSVAFPVIIRNMGLSVVRALSLVAFSLMLLPLVLLNAYLAACAPYYVTYGIMSVVFAL